MDFFYEKFPRAETLFWKSGLFFDFFDLQILTKARLEIVLFLLFKNFFLFFEIILLSNCVFVKSQFGWVGRS